MPDPAFYVNDGPISLQQICDLTNAKINDDVDGSISIKDVAALDLAGKSDLAFFDNPKYLDQLGTTDALACFVAPKFVDRVSDTVIAFVTDQPYRAFAKVALFLYPLTRNPGITYSRENSSGAGLVHTSARISKSATVEPGAVVGEGACIGAGAIICSGAVVGRCVKIGKNSYIGANVSVCYALIGDHVVIHSGVQIGQDGFGFAMGADFHLKVPQLGRVIIQDHVEIGANTTIDRGTTHDTIIGDGTKIDNQVQIAHNVKIGRHCIIVAQTGISGSARLGDFVALGGQSGVLGHVSIGDGAQIAASSRVRGEVPAGARWGGAPAKPIRQWFREITTLRKLAEREDKKYN
jgi:UDP-3-O-[3-hydroxymyristoyl] glucosamine N-acyltransferase